MTSKPETIEAWACVRGCDNSFTTHYSEKAALKHADDFGGTVVRLTGELPKTPNVEDDFVKVTVDGVDYYDSKEELTHQEALDLAAKHGLRVLERWELSRLYDENEAFRKSLEHKWYWSASVFSSSRDYVWRFNGNNGNVDYSYRNYTTGVRCVSKKELSE
jgi:hypothetical protein